MARPVDSMSQALRQSREHRTWVIGRIYCRMETTWGQGLQAFMAPPPAPRGGYRPGPGFAADMADVYRSRRSPRVA